jgi:hypothetical protein
MVFLSSRISPLTHVHCDLLGQVTGRHGRRHLGNVAHLSREVGAHGVDRIGQVFPGTGHALHIGLAAQFSFGAHFARDPRHLGRKGAQLVHHGVDGVLEFEDFALDVHRDLFGQVTGGHGRRHLGDVAHLRGQVGAHGVDRVGQVLPGAGHALHVGLAAQLAFGAHLARDTRHLGGEGAQLVHHGVDGGLEFQDFALHVYRDFFGQVACRHGFGHLGDVAHLACQVGAHGVDRVGQVFPGTGHALHVSLAAQLAFGAHLSRHASPRRRKKTAGPPWC